MGEEGSEKLVLDVFQENSSTTVEDAGGVREEELLDSKKLLSELVDEGGTKEQEEIGEQIHVQERIQVLLCPLQILGYQHNVCCYVFLQMPRYLDEYWDVEIYNL